MQEHSCWKYFGIVNYKYILIIKIVQYVPEMLVLYLA